jgi:diphthine-ammonia ligase
LNFIMSYSCGKDSALALDRMVHAGHRCLGLLVMVNREQERSWFHGVDRPLLNEIASALELPLFCCDSAGEDYHLAMEEGLRRAKELGAEACCFGDIDAEDNARWCRERCEHTGLVPQFPLWGGGHRQLAEETLQRGYRALVKCVRNDCLPQELLGRPLTPQLLTEMERLGVDPCGEGGEYHTLVVDGPLFCRPVDIVCKAVLDFGRISAVDIRLRSGQDGSR